MAFNISLFDLPGAVFLGALIIVVISIIILLLTERKMNRNLAEKKQAEQSFYQRKIEEIKEIEGKPQEFLIKMDKIARDFFAEKFGVNKNLKYLEMIDFFNKKNKKDISSFCERMQEALYGGTYLYQEELDYLLKNLRKIVEIEKMIDLGAGKDIKNEESSPQEIKEFKAIEINEEMPMEKRVLEYVEEGRRRGFSFMALKQKLLEKKFNEKDIDRVIFYLNKEEQKLRGTNANEFKKERMSVQQNRSPGKGIEYHKYVKSLDDLDRLKVRIKENRGKDALDTVHRKIGII